MICLSNSISYFVDFEPIQQYRECASSVISDGKAYVLGGYFNSTYLRSCEVYDIENNEWSDITPMAAPRYQTGAAILNRYVCQIGPVSTLTWLT